MTRFTTKFVESSGCWEWTSSKHPRGYGTFWLEGKVQYAHRVSYMLFKGTIPRGLEVCHSCDNPGCVNPDHLFVGTHLENMQDMTRKGRRQVAFGENHGTAKLRSTEVKAIRKLYRTFSTRELAKKFKVAQSTISNVLCKGWRNG